MPIVSAKEFSELCSIEQKQLYVYKKRGKILVRSDKCIDTNQPVNAEFMRKMQENAEIRAKENKKTEVVDEPEKKNGKRGKRVIEKKIKETEQNPEYIGQQILNRIKAEKAQLELDSLRLQNKLKHGEMILISDVEKFISIHFNSIFATFHNAIDGTVIDICNELGASREKISEIRQRLRNLVNDSVEKSKNKTRSDLIKSIET